jgi:F-type H+-transporting ATPase subunit epsilon
MIIRTILKIVIMTNKLLKFTISRVDEPIFDGEVMSVTLPGIAGEMTILPNHTALISPLKKGIVTYISADSIVSKLEINSGTLEISKNHATVLI